MLITFVSDVTNGDELNLSVANLFILVLYLNATGQRQGSPTLQCHPFQASQATTHSAGNLQTVRIIHCHFTYSELSFLHVTLKQ